MFNNKKGSLPVLELIFILLLSTVILISWVLVLLSAQNFYIDERKIQTQLVIHNILSKDCFGDGYAVFNLDEFTQESLDTCLSGLDNSTLVRAKLGSKSIVSFKKEEEFKKKAILCTRSGSTLCTEMMYPVRILSQNNEEMEILILQNIVTVS